VEASAAVRHPDYEHTHLTICCEVAPFELPSGKMYACTLARYHKGIHRAMVGDHLCLASWENVEPERKRMSWSGRFWLAYFTLALIFHVLHAIIPSTS
jgi:hypothetical protein